MTRISLNAALAAAGLAVCATAAFAQSGTVNGYSSADEAKAMAAVTAAGFTPGVVATAQAGNLFVTAKKGGASFTVTVTPDGHVYGGPSLGAQASAAADNPFGPKAPRAAGRGPVSGGD